VQLCQRLSRRELALADENWRLQMNKAYMR